MMGFYIPLFMKGRETNGGGHTHGAHFQFSSSEADICESRYHSQPDKLNRERRFAQKPEAS